MRSSAPSSDQDAHPGGGEDPRDAPEGDGAADGWTEEEPDHLAGLELRVALTALALRGEVGEGGAQGGQVGSAAGALTHTEQGQPPERTPIGEKGKGEDGEEHAARHQHRLAPHPVHEVAGGDLDEGAGDEGTGDEEGDVGRAASVLSHIEGDDGEERGDAGEHDELG